MKSFINVIDIETINDSKSLIPYCCCIILKGKKIHSYGLNCIENIINYIYSLKINNLVFFAHNLTFDGSLILNNINADWEIVQKGSIIRKGNIYSLCIKKQNIFLTFKCSSKILPIELSEIANKLNIPKKIEINHKDINIENYNDKDIKNKVKLYCERDTEIVNQFMVKLSLVLNKYIKDWYLVCFSISGIAYNIFKNNFNNFEIDLKLNYNIDIVLRKAYYGGRCEVFGNAYEDDYIYHFDFTGMYSNRLKELFPIGIPEKKINPKWNENPGFYYIKVKSDMKIPILPYRCKKTGKLLFPNGEFEGLYWYEEISLFLREGGVILDILWSIEYKKMEKVFENFAINCIERRKESLIDNIVWKMIPNSFIGRLGLRNDNEKTIILDDSEYDPRCLDVISDKRINNKWIVRVREDNIKETVSNVTYSSIVTSKARVVWWEHANKIIKEGGRILYCDTDSLFIAFKENKINSRWGEVFLDESKEDTIIKKACFACSKAYSIVYQKNNLTKIKGIPKKDIKNMVFEEFEEMFKSQKYKKIKMDYFRKRNLDIRIEEILKIVRIGEYDKRIFSDDKRETTAVYIKN